MQNRKKLTLEEKNIYSQKYIEILKQKGDLLVEVDGELKLVEIDYYDNEILKFLNYDRWSYIYEAIGEFISLYEIDISDEFILNRLISLEKNNIVEIKFNNNEIYNSKIRKKTNWFYYFEWVVSKWFKIIKRGNSFLYNIIGLVLTDHSEKAILESAKENSGEKKSKIFSIVMKGEKNIVKIKQSLYKLILIDKNTVN